ncbi:MAG: hypothetical protein D6739_04155, partial [Nitrospirae bacterium]
PPDQAAREAALDPTRSFLVRAPAGSGKTELLIQRFLRLLPAVPRPEAIVAITFTRKAAAEMAERISDALRQAAAGEPVAGAHRRHTRALAEAALAADRERGWGLLDHPGRLRIRTIDALCLELVGRLPLLSRLAGAAQPTEEADRLHRLAAEQALASGEAEGDPHVARLLAHVGGAPERFVALVAELLARRGQARELLGRASGPGARRDFEAALERLVARELASLAQEAPDAVAQRLPWLAAYAARRVEPDSPIAACEGLEALPGPEAAALPLWRGLAALLLVGDGGKGRYRLRRPGGVNRTVGFPPGPRGSREAAAKAELQGLLELLEGHPGWVARLALCRDLPEPRYEDAAWSVAEAAVAVVKRAAAHLWLLFREQGRVDFTEVALEAIDALGSSDDPSDLLLAVDAEVRHLLVDEYQDTSRGQQRLLELLTAGWEPGDGRTLFLVGDPMQSIYRFREAEVALFLEAAREGVGPVRPERLTLEANFRSAPELVAWANERLAPLFPAAEEPAAGWVPYTKA